MCSWRDATVLATLDCFYNKNDVSAVLHGKHPQKIAEAWQQGNDSGLKGKEGNFSEEDRRVLWGSYYRYGRPMCRLLDQNLANKID